MKQTVAENKIWSNKKRNEKTRNKENRSTKAAYHDYQNKRTLKYAASILVFVLLILSALWLPQVFFDVSDALMYGEVSLMEQEKPDVLTLTTGYEESLFRRLAGFAEGLAGQRQYYVDEQPKEVTDEIQEFLFESVLRYYAYGIYEDMIVGMFTESMLGYTTETFARKAGLDLYQWNQYVIYSDDYAQGVNFILWCFGLKNSLGDNMTILMDAHDYTVYAVQITGGMERSALSVDIIEIYREEYEEHLNVSVSTTKEFNYLLESLYTQGSVWMNLNIYYEIFDQKELERYFSNVEGVYAMWRNNELETIAGIAGVLKDCAGNDVEVYLNLDSNTPYGADGEGWYGIGADDILYYSIPVNENKITFDMYSFGEVYDAGQAISSTMGIREIYELIPEFQHVG